MLLKDSSQVEKESRFFFRSRSLKLSSLTLPIAFDAMEEFWTTSRFSDVLPENGDRIACYEDVTEHGRGTRLEIGLVRLLRPSSSDSKLSSPVNRLRLRLCYRWDMDVIAHVLPAGTWAFACWDFPEFETFKRSVLNTAGFSAMQDKKSAEVNALFDMVSAVQNELKPAAEARQMWWGVL
ncbi:hypothetical protein [Pseudoduganella buxea]|uniref:Uncharacterized protein n=2 Tax=Pseudoduganella buxea TaxID=1949069 RepID=A0A6I3T5G9_9BURK|nr:hypothetical protein [Pseudoduganella buxea]MTV55712.1 hypothetical protein [Pseudoduganella buxea]